MTWAQVGPLVGVIVGAVLGGGAQILNDAIKARRDLRQQRIESVRQFVFALTRVQAARDTANGYIDALKTGLPTSQALDRSVALYDAIHEVDACRTYCKLVDGSPLTAELVNRLADNAVSIVTEQEFDRDSMIADLDALAAHARRR